uniref:Anoctamin transmembrane domain-containing protein n=1 Tax=Chromera velia CCMP2878 TaxID=1169474 RepID=A0A0G4HJ75_9ALVE|eukprot:Cvel_28168.t1-p1 / transcript=Cvel_28168.t1 / gene=Cvel_28168 / organism=Chromera_velia_CCMP2878 / gene_product=Anoctamin-10, putative / transcript_product=Anoctamin-10, putative / location=Cvel_scaffold3640:4322-12728(+) / protein_length=1692 / sequence_SO=supercontig / SO=protein_coding / is_pseudo=false
MRRDGTDVPPVLESERDLKACFMGCYDVNDYASPVAPTAESPLHGWQYVLVLKNGAATDEETAKGKDKKSIDLRRAVHLFNDCFGGEEVVVNGRSEQEARFEVEKQAFIAAFSALPEVIRKRDTETAEHRHTLASQRRQAAAEELRCGYVENREAKQEERAHTSEQLLDLYFAKGGQSRVPVSIHTPSLSKKLFSGTPFPFQMDSAPCDGFLFNRNRNFLDLMQRVILTKLVLHCQLEVKILTPKEHGGDTNHLYVLIRSDEGDIRREAARGCFDYALNPLLTDPLALEPVSEDFIPLHEAYMELFERRPDLMDSEVIGLLRQTGAKLAEMPETMLKKHPSLSSLLEWFRETGFKMIEDLEGEAEETLGSSNGNERGEEEVEGASQAAAEDLEAGGVRSSSSLPPQRTLTPGAHALFVSRVETLLEVSRERFSRGGSVEDAKKVSKVLVREVLKVPDRWVQTYARRRLVPPLKSGKGVLGNLQEKVDARMMKVLPAFKDYLRLRMSSPTLDTQSLMRIANTDRRGEERLQSLWHLLDFREPPPMYTRFSFDPSLELLWQKHTVRRPQEEGGEFKSIGPPASVLKTLHSLISRQIRCHHLIREGIAVAFFPLDSSDKFADPRLLAAASFDGRLRAIEARHKRAVLEWTREAAEMLRLSDTMGDTLCDIPDKPKKPSAHAVKREWKKMPVALWYARFCVLLRSLKPDMPADSVRAYFGEKVGFYFALLGFITLMMVPVAVVGIPTFITQQAVRDRDEHLRMGMDSLFSFLMVLWMSLLVYGWETKEWVLKERWGMQRLKERRGGSNVRPGFRGDSKRSPVDDSETEVFFPTWVQASRVAVGVGVIAVFVSASASISYGLAVVRTRWVREVDEAAEDYVRGEAGPPAETVSFFSIKSQAILFTSFLNILINMVFSMVVRNIVTARLAEWCNLKTQSAHDKLLFVSSFAVDFVVGFFPFFYTAFLKPFLEGCIEKPPSEPFFGGRSRLVTPAQGPSCAEELQVQLASSYVIKIGLNALELGMPAIMPAVMLQVKKRIEWVKKKVQRGEKGKETATKEAAEVQAAKRVPDESRDGTVHDPHLREAGGALGIATAAPTERGDIESAVLPAVSSSPPGISLRDPTVGASIKKKEGAGAASSVGSLATGLMRKGEYASLSGSLDGLFEDFNEVTVMLCFICLFAVAFPIAPLLGLVFFVLESKVDAVKLFHLLRRPTPQESDGIGPWLPLYKVLLALTAGMQAALLAYVFHSLDFMFPHVAGLKEGAGLNDQPVYRHAAFAFAFLFFLLTIWVVAASMAGLRKHALHGTARLRVQARIAKLSGEGLRCQKEGVALPSSSLPAGQEGETTNTRSVQTSDTPDLPPRADPRVSSSFAESEKVPKGQQAKSAPSTPKDPKSHLGNPGGRATRSFSSSSKLQLSVYGHKSGDLPTRLPSRSHSLQQPSEAGLDSEPQLPGDHSAAQREEGPRGQIEEGSGPRQLEQFYEKKTSEPLHQQMTPVADEHERHADSRPVSGSFCRQPLPSRNLDHASCGSCAVDRLAELRVLHARQVLENHEKETEPKHAGPVTAPYSRTGDSSTFSHVAGKGRPGPRGEARQLPDLPREDIACQTGSHAGPPSHPTRDLEAESRAQGSQRDSLAPAGKGSCVVDRLHELKVIHARRDQARGIRRAEHTEVLNLIADKGFCRLPHASTGQRADALPM